MVASGILRSVGVRHRRWLRAPVLDNRGLLHASLSITCTRVEERYSTMDGHTSSIFEPALLITAGPEFTILVASKIMNHSFAIKSVVFTGESDSQTSFLPPCIHINIFIYVYMIYVSLYTDM